MPCPIGIKLRDDKRKLLREDGSCLDNQTDQEFPYEEYS